MNKWTKEWAVDVAERVGTTAIYGVITMLTANASGAVDGDPQVWWLIVGLPSVLSLLKAVLANLGADPEVAPSASLVKITSTRSGGE